MRTVAFLIMCPFATARPAAQFCRALSILMVLALCTVVPSMATTWTVTSLADDGSLGTLRYAIMNATDGDTISFQVNGTIVLSQGSLEISKGLTITGPGAPNLAISGNNVFRVVQIDAGASAVISGVTIENGNLSTGCCGAGGGIYNAGSLTLSDSAVLNNSAGYAGYGGGIYNDSFASLALIRTTLSGNSADNYGGAIYAYGGTTTVINSTLANNHAYFGAGIMDGGTVNVSSSTFSGNSGNVGNGIFGNGGLITLKNTMFASDGGYNCYPGGSVWHSLDHNLSDDLSCPSIFVQPHDLNNTPAGLDAGGLKDNGGPTQTIALVSGSPAIDAIPVSPTNYCTDVAGNPVTTDQRGVTRPQGRACDIGAYELRQPTTWTVTSLADDGSAGTLRSVLAQVNDGDSINFAVTGTITLLTGSLEVSTSVTIAGPGAASLAVSGNGQYTVFQIDRNTTVAISKITIENGGSRCGNGGGIYNNGTLTLTESTLSGNSNPYQGGAIYNAGSLTIGNSTFGNNGGNSGCNFYGAAILNSGTLAVSGSTFSNNVTAQFGGAILNQGSAAITNSTFWGNIAQSYGGGAAIMSFSGSLNISNSTFAKNSATGSYEFGGNTIDIYGGSITTKASIFANGSSGGNCHGPIVSQGYNLSDDNSCTTFGQIGDANNTAAGLDPNGLQNNGGPTQTVGLVAGSAALDAIPIGPTNFCTDLAGNPVTTDQRGVTRPQGPACDIGAFEARVFTTTTLTSSANPSVVGQSVTFTAPVTPSSGTGTPIGTVKFRDGTITLGTGRLGTNGEATYTTSTLAQGTHSITASYGGDSQFEVSTSAVLSQAVITQISTSTTLISSVNPSVLGQFVTFTATVTPSSGTGTPTGTVTFKDGTTALGSVTLNASGQATYTTSSLAQGTHSITAQYSDDSTYASSTSAALTQVVNVTNSAVGLSSSSLSFGDWGVGTTSTVRSSTLTNTGNAALSITSILASGDFALATTGTSCPYAGGSVNAGASCTIDVTFTPTTTGTRTGTVRITDNAADSPQVVSLSGTGVTSTTAPGGLQSWWPGDGNFNDIRGPNPGTSAGGVTFVPGEVGQAFHFRGTANSYFTVPNSATFAPASNHVTIAAWIRPDFTVSNVLDTIFNKRDGCGYNRSYMLVVTKAGAVGLGYPLGTIGWSASVANDDALSTVQFPQDNQFHFVAGTYDGSYMNVYLDGVLVGQKAHSGPIPVTSEPPYIGLQGGCGDLTVADIDELQFYDTALSQSEILAIYNAANAGVSQNAPVPFISQPLLPAAVTPGGQAFTLTVNGTGFVPGATVNWNGSTLATTFINNQQLTAAVPAAKVAAAGTASVTASNPAPGGGTSNVAYLEITNPTTSVVLSNTDYSVGQRPYFITTGDFNVDGKLDLAVANAASDNVSVLLSNGDGTFQAPVNYSVAGARAVAVGDFNGDGKLDLAVASSTTNAISVLLGNGDGTFQAAVNYSVGTTPISVAVGDFDGDGKLDLVVANNGSDNISVLLGNGDGTFQGAMNYSVGRTPAYVEVGDFNGDGKLDVAQANFSSNSVSVLLGNGDGTFQAAVNYDVGISPIAVEVGDFNGDGKLDLATANADDSTASVLLGNGDGSFQQARSYSTGNPGGRNYGLLTLGDLNGDGKLDLVVAIWDDNTVNVLLGNGDGTFQPPVVYSAASGPISVAVGDFNGDGRLDFATANHGGNSVSILLQAPAVSLSANSVTFGNQNPGTTSTPQPVTITNSGSATLAISNIALTGANPGDFGFTSDSLPVSLPPAGSTTVQVTFTPTAAGSRSASLSITDNASASPQIVNLSGRGMGATGTTLVSSANPSTIGQSVTFTATVTPSSGTGTPTGTVTFKDGTTTLGSGTLNSNGQATYTTASLTIGTHSITASYGGDSQFNASTSASLSQLVNKSSTSTGGVSSLNPSTFGQLVTFTATVTSSGGTPTGTVTFYDGATTLGTGTLNSSGQVKLSTANLSGGLHTITVAYGGDSTFATSTSSALTQNVNRATTSTTLSSSPNPSIYGQTATFTATVNSAAGAPTGMVTFYDGATALGTGTLNSGRATLSTAGLTAGTHMITAAYGGDTNFATSTSPGLAQTVSKAATTNTLTSSPNPSTMGQTVNLVAAVSGQYGGIATGSLTFKDGSNTVLGTASLVNGTATLPVSTLGTGSHTITAVYGGDSNFNGSTSNAITQTVVSKAATTTTVSSSLNPSYVGQLVTFAATVSPSSATGTVTFKAGQTVLGTGNLSSGTATFSTSSLAAGSFNIVAVYSGDAQFASSTSSSITQTVNKAATTTVLSSAPNPSTVGQLVTFKAIVTSPTGVTPSGSVAFNEGSTTLGIATLDGSGAATFSKSTLSKGKHNVKAVYGATSAFSGSTSAVITQVVQ